AEGNDIRGLAQLIVAKHRSGGVGDVKLRFVSKYAKFENWNEGYDVMQETLQEAPLRLGSRMNNRDSRPTDDMPHDTFSFNQPGDLGGMPDIMPGPGDQSVPF
ncbi:MAG: DnaB-like helicase C-terminal domain-containing protein, partial [Muribaculaceae bacterium]|nr:DnaB-like helicase C-terminal domain-containing protein [Muribaculaceae bacterium]